MREIAAAVDDDDPLMLLGLASAVVAAADERPQDPFAGPPDDLTLESMVETLLATPRAETSALLLAVAALAGDEVLGRRVRQAVAHRGDPLPGWLADLSRTEALPRAVEATHVLGDGDDVLISVVLPGGRPLTAVVFIDHNLGTAVTDAFVAPAPLDELLEELRQDSADDPDTATGELAPADARRRIQAAVERGAELDLPLESETWPACRPLVEWMAGLLPTGGTGYRFPEWDDVELAELADRFRAAPEGAAHTDDVARELLEALLWFGAEHTVGDPMRWSPAVVEILLHDWIPTALDADDEQLATVPDLLRALIRFCHRERGIRPALTEQTLAAVDELEPEYQRVIRERPEAGPPPADPALIPLADGCTLLTRARALAGFVGDGRPVTAKSVLRRVDVGPACAAIGLPDPGRVVTAANVPALHRAWLAAVGAGLIVLDRDRAAAAEPTGDPIAQWLDAVLGVLRAESDDPFGIGASVVCRVVLSALDKVDGIDQPGFGSAVQHVLMRLPDPDEQLAAFRAFRRGMQRDVAALELLAECGAVDVATATVTPLGRWALAALADPPAPAPAWADDDVLQLKVGLDRFSPPVWRRILAPAGTSLGLLHRVLQIAFEWDDDHLHVFTVDGAEYADRRLECYDEDDLTLAAALPRIGATLAYQYDLGASWDHTVRLEKVLPADPDARITCTDGRGDAPVEDWGDEEPPPARPFRLAEVDARLSALRARA